MNLELQGRVVVVTGGSEGIGRATALALGREGAHVVICARRADVLEAARVDLVQQTGGRVLAVAADVRRADDVTRVVELAVREFGGVDGLVNNAGTSRSGAFEQVTDAVWQDDLDQKVFAAVRFTRACLPHFRARGGGSVVNLLNIGARQPAAASLPTSVSRAAGLALTKALSKELAPEQVRVNAVLIGVVKSAQHERTRAVEGATPEAFYAALARKRQVPLGRVGETAEAADLITFLLSPRAGYLTGDAINLDGGASAVP
jgi:NAD(P)-dependent dehydrogenase (short-subunit alcohol dehydrogenase family)